MDFQEINHLLKLSRLEIAEEEKQDISNQLEEILNYVQKLSEIPTENIEPVNGGTTLINIFRSDENPRIFEKTEDLIEMFFEEENRYLKIPPIFEGNN